MATKKTEATELSVGFGILGVEPLDRKVDIEQLFLDNSLSTQKWKEFQEEYVRGNKLYKKFFELGLQLRQLRFSSVKQLIWAGPQQQAATTSGAKDLFIPSLNMPISVKNDSNVVLNASPHNLFRSLPQGKSPASRAEHWFLEKDPQGYQQFYEFARGLFPGNLPHTAEEFETQISRSARDEFQDFVTKKLTGQNQRNLTTLYATMCRTVAQNSATEFNTHLDELPSNERSAVYESVMRQFFRLDAVPYLLVGLDKGKGFAVQIPDLTAWKRQWRVESIEAVPDLNRGQSVVKIAVSTANKPRKTEFFDFGFRVEIRWSHGKFCGNPEGKLYKSFPWTSVPFFENLI
jgi:hypothetical protein